MSEQNNSLPHLSDKVFLSDGGLETVLIFHHGLELPCFASFDLLKDAAGTTILRDYYRPYIDSAIEGELGFVLDTPTWRASSDWLQQLGYDANEVHEINRKAAELMEGIRQEFQTVETPMVIAGAVGPRGDGYVAGAKMTADDAYEYHLHQIRGLADGGADLISAATMTYVDEAIGIVRAARTVGVPVTVGFTTETNGLLPDGDTLESAINCVDSVTDFGPAYYMINCAHFDHFKDALTDNAEWSNRVRAVRANASRLSHAELDESIVLDDGDPEEFGQLCAELHRRFSNLSVFGGCCGTDHRHVDAARRAIE